MTDSPFLSATTPAEVAADLLILGCLEGGEPPVDGLPEALRNAVTRLARRAGFDGREGQYVETSLDDSDGAEPRVAAVALAGLGKADALDARRLATWFARMGERSRCNRVRSLAFRLPDHPVLEGAAGRLRLSLSAAATRYRFDRYRTSPDLDRSSLETVSLVLPEGHDQEFGLAGAVTAGASWTRDLANTPANVATPVWMARQAEDLTERGFDLKVFEPEELRERGMGGILAVGSGSENPPRLVRLERGPTHGDAVATVALVGKGVTFDTGGISIKPARDMDEMKYDKSGACTALGVGHAVAELDLPIRLRLYLPLAENMPDGRSYRPGDIVTCYNGKTVEIINTDAEGRMILADALALAVEEEADHIVEMSTLTGASVIALGFRTAALYTPDDSLADALLSAAETAGERLWRMPLWPEHTEAMRGRHADLKNAGGRWGSANTAAAFLGEFAGPHPSWAHLDIAGPAYVSGDDGSGPKGSTGYGVAFLTTWLRSLCERAAS